MRKFFNTDTEQENAGGLIDPPAAEQETDIPAAEEVKDTPAAEQTTDTVPAEHLTEIDSALDCFHGKVVLLQNDAMMAEPARYKVAQERKAVVTGYLTEEQALRAFDQFINDTMF